MHAYLNTNFPKYLVSNYAQYLGWKSQSATHESFGDLVELFAIFPPHFGSVDVGTTLIIRFCKLTDFEFIF
jgi:hypothetical protein